MRAKPAGPRRGREQAALPPFIAVVIWDSAEAFQAAMESAEGRATIADLANFSGAGVQLLTGPSRAVV